MDFDEAKSPKPALIERAIDNASSVLRALLPGGELRSIHSGAGDVLLGAFVFVLIQVLAGLIAGPADVFFRGIPFRIGLAAMFALTICFFAAVLGRSGLVPSLATGALWAMSMGRLAGMVAETAFGLSNSQVGELMVLGLTAFPALMFALASLGPIVGGSAAAAGLAVMLIFGLSNLAQQTGGDSADGFPHIEPEDLFAAQNQLMNRQLEDILPGDPAKPELFAILGAGHPFQQVFAREVEAVANILASDFEADRRIVRLVNSARQPLAAPLLSRQNLKLAISSLGARMQDDDILLLFLTSHGQPGHLDTEFSPFIGYSLSADDIAKALKGGGDGPTIAVISACHSGSLAGPLAAPNRLVITAADADSVSFGCKDENEWTEWGRAFWIDALSQARDPRVAARIAQGIVAEREAAEDLPPSDPMIVEGKFIGAALDRWLAILGP